MGFMPFWQPSTLCFDAVSFHSCIVVSWRINLSLYVDAAYLLQTDLLGLSVSVGLSICRNLEPCKNSRTDRDAVWAVDLSWSKKSYVRWGSRSPIGRDNFEERTLSARQTAG